MKPHTTIKAEIIQEYKKAYYVKLPDGRKTWLPYSQIIEHKGDTFKISPWLARKIKEEAEHY